MDNQSRDNEKNSRSDAMQERGEIAFKYFQEEKYDKAIQEYNQVIEETRGLDESSQLALFLTYRALAKFEFGERVENLHQDLLEAMELAIASDNAALLLNAKLVLAEIYRDSGSTPKAIEQFLDAFDLGNLLKDPESQELALSNLGRLYLDRGWSEQALACYRHLLDTVEEPDNRAAILGSLGLCMAELGKFEDAINSYRTAYLEAELEGDLSSMSVCLGSEGNVLFETESYERALKCYEKALVLAESSSDERRRGAWLGNIGTTLVKLGRLEEALSKLEEAERIAARLEDVHSRAAHLDSIGDCLVASGKLEEARAKYEEALEISKEMEDRLGQRIYLTSLGRVYQRLGQLQPAFDYLGQAVEIFDEQRATICADDLKTSFANRGEDLYKDVVDICLSMGKRVEALEFIGRAKSRALLDLLSNSPIDLSLLADEGDDALRKLIDKEKELRAQIDHLERVIWQGPTGLDSTSRGATISGEDTKQVYSEWRDTVNQLKRSHPNYASLVSAQTLDYESIQALWKTAEEGNSGVLDESTCLIEFYSTGDYLMTMAVWSGLDEPVVSIISDPEKRELLEVDLETFLEMASTEGWEVPKSLCKRIYEALLGEVMNSIPEALDRLIIVPHGNLFHLPFAALHDGEAYLCEKFTLSYLPSLTLIPVLSGTAQGMSITSGDKYLISAISDYSATRQNGLVLSSTLRSSAGLDDLSYTLEEANSIFKLSEDKSQVKEAKLLTNEEVKEVFPDLFSEYPVVHFAGHAVFNDVEPMASGLVLSDGTILTAASILERRSLKTHCGRLLVLSACQTGVNKVTAGGEVLGLARALIYAGMPNLILTLWEVADRSTSDLMKSFHDHWQSSGKASIASALQKVQREAIESGLPLHAWAPFIHFGID